MMELDTKTEVLLLGILKMQMVLVEVLICEGTPVKLKVVKEVQKIRDETEKCVGECTKQAS